MKIKVLLLSDVERLGRAGEVKEVSRGYAFNFLFRKNLAVEAKPHVLNKLKQQIENEQRKRQKEEERAREIAKKLTDAALVIKKKAGKSGKLFGSVTQKDIEGALLNQFGIILDKKKILIPAQIKSIGVFTLRAELGYGIEQEFSIKVEPLSDT